MDLLLAATAIGSSHAIKSALYLIVCEDTMAYISLYHHGSFSSPLCLYKISNVCMDIFHATSVQCIAQLCRLALTLQCTQSVKEMGR